MTLGKFLVVGLLVLAGIAAAGYAVRGCRHSSENALRQYVGNQVCLACGHEWHMDTKVMMEERLKDPTGHRFTQCPKCGAWRGVAVGRCAKCGKRMPKVAMRENADGTITTWQRRLCDQCAQEQGAEPGSEGVHEQ